VSSCWCVLHVDRRVEREPCNVRRDAEHPETTAEEDLVFLVWDVEADPEAAAALHQAEGLFARRFAGGPDFPDEGQRSLCYLQSHSSLTFVMKRRTRTRKGYRPPYKSSVR